ncbi:hypothetical protein K438DRAFT_1795746 [Mycena galopus ATCC 62051]|nr:hypothetical protein K438DRAFT_1795746 [Mycena galopus ATCC 62051]
MASDVEMVDPEPSRSEVEEQEEGEGDSHEQHEDEDGGEEQHDEEQEHEVGLDDSSEEENSSDNASEDDVDKDLVPAPDDHDDPHNADAAMPDGADPDAAPAPTPDAPADAGPIRIPMLVDPAPAALGTVTPPRATSPLSAPPTSAAKPTPAPAPTQKPKPKSHHAALPPPPPPPPAPMQTIRLEIRLGGPDNYEVDVKGMAREEGLVWGEIGEKKYADDSSEGEEGSDGEEEKEDAKEKEAKEKKDADGDVEMDADGKPKPPKKTKPKKKSKATAEYYDTNDPFIDDSELAIDERTYFAQTKQKGFYVSSGEVALVRDKSPKKPKSKKKVGPALSLNLPTASTSALKPLSTAAAGGRKAKSVGGAGSKSAPASKVGADKALGTKDSPIALEDDDDEKGDVFGPGATQDAGGRRASGKGKEKAEEGDEAAIAEGVNRMKGKWKERVSVNGASPSANGESVNGDGDVKVEEDEEDEVGKKRKRAGALNGVGGDGTKKRKTVDIASFHPDLQVGIEKLKQAIASESWEQKSKFPPNLKPLLAALSLQAITLDEYDDNFFSLMPTIFPYNKFTMSKLIKRTIFPDHTALLNQRQDELLERLRTLATEGFPKAQEEWEKSLQNYEDKRKEKALTAANGDPDSVEGSTGPTRHGTEDPEGGRGSAGPSSVDKDEKEGGGGGKDGNGKEGPGKGGAHHGPPLKKYRMTEAMKQNVWQLVLLSNEICRLENEKNSLEGSVLQVSEQGLRKVLYQRIVAAFPEGWMSSGQISRDVSAMKKKYEKEVADD